MAYPVRRQYKIGENEEPFENQSFDSISSCIESDLSMNLEDQMAQIQAQIEEYLPQTEYYRVGKQKLPFDDKDPIFMASGPAKTKVNTDSCSCCKDVVFKQDSDKVFCKFCGQNSCKACC